MSRPRAANSVVDSEKEPGVAAYGVLRLCLCAGSYDCKFLPARRDTFTDSGSNACH